MRVEISVMIQRFIKFIQINTSTRKVVLGLLIILLVNTILFPFFPKLMGLASFSIHNILDLKLSYTPDIVYSLFSQLEEDGRNVYKSSTLFIDMPYAIFYGFVYSFSLVLLLKKTSFSDNSFLILVPFGISFFDILENIGILSLLYHYPTRLNHLVVSTSLATSLKWLFAVLSILLLIILLFKQKVWAKKENTI